MFNNPKKNNELIIQNLLEVKDFITESLKEARNIQKDIDDGGYEEAYSFRFMKLDEAPEDSVIIEVEGFGNPIQYSYDEYLAKYPHMLTRKKLVGIPNIKSSEDVCYGLNIKELESDLEYINEELRRYNANNKMIQR